MAYGKIKIIWRAADFSSDATGPPPVDTNREKTITVQGMWQPSRAKNTSIACGADLQNLTELWIVPQTRAWLLDAFAAAAAQNKILEAAPQTEQDAKASPWMLLITPPA